MGYGTQRKRTRRKVQRKRRKSYRKRRSSGKGLEGRTSTYSRSDAPRVNPNFKIAPTRRRAKPRRQLRINRRYVQKVHRAPRSPSNVQMKERLARLPLVGELYPTYPASKDWKSTGPLVSIWHKKHDDYNASAATIQTPVPIYELLPNPS